jgi:hypothetical protein
LELAALVNLLQSLPEIRALMRCAHRYKVRVGLSGGVLRNILIADPNTIFDDRSLFDFVDPFGDIDLVFHGRTNDGVFLQALLSEIADADSHVWDSQTPEARARSNERSSHAVGTLTSLLKTVDAFLRCCPEGNRSHPDYQEASTNVEGRTRLGLTAHLARSSAPCATSFAITLISISSGFAILGTRADFTSELRF